MHQYTIYSFSWVVVKTRSAHCGDSKRIVDEDLLVLIHVESRDEDSVVAHIDQVRIGLIRRICAASNFMDLWQKIVVFHRWWLGIQATAFCVVGSDMLIALCSGVHSFQSENNNKLNIGESTTMKRFAQRHNLHFQLLCSSLRNELPPVHSQNLSWLYLFVQEKATPGLWNLGPPNWKLWQPNFFCEFGRIAFIRKQPDSARFRHIHLAVRRKAWRRTTDAHGACGWCPEHYSLPKEEWIRWKQNLQTKCTASGTFLLKQMNIVQICDWIYICPWKTKKSQNLSEATSKKKPYKSSCISCWTK